MQMIRPSHDILQMNIAMQHRACEPQTLDMNPAFVLCCRHAAVLTSEPIKEVCVQRVERHISGDTSLCTSHGGEAALAVPRARLDAGMDGRLRRIIGSPPDNREDPFGQVTKPNPSTLVLLVWKHPSAHVNRCFWAKSGLDCQSSFLLRCVPNEHGQIELTLARRPCFTPLPTSSLNRWKCWDRPMIPEKSTCIKKPPEDRVSGGYPAPKMGVIRTSVALR
jgi:hypothetical protein